MPARVLIATAGNVRSPTFWSASAVMLCGSSSARSSSRGEARSRSRKCAARRMPDIGCLRALLVDHDAEGRRGDLAELEPLDRRIFHVAVPVDAHRAVGVVDGLGIGRVAEEFRLAGGRVRLPGLPMLGLALDDGGLGAR